MKLIGLDTKHMTHYLRKGLGCMEKELLYTSVYNQKMMLKDFTGNLMILS